MDDRQPSHARPPVNVATAQIAKAALLRLAQAQLEPTPENYARAYVIESGLETTPTNLPEKAQLLLAKLLSLSVTQAQARLELQICVREARWDEALRQVERVQQSDGPAAQAEALAQTLVRLVRGLERGGRQWTVARKKDSVQRVLEGQRSNTPHLLQRLQQLVSSWDSDVPNANISSAELLDQPSEPGPFFTDDDVSASGSGPAEATPLSPPLPTSSPTWPAIQTSLHGALQQALHSPEGHADALMAELANAHRELLAQGETAERAALIERLCQRARLLLEHRHQLFGERGDLCRELSAGLLDLAEDDSWAHGQCEAMNHALAQGLTGRSVRAVTELLGSTRQRQRDLRDQRARARDALKSLIHQMLAELGELGEHTDRFQHSVGRYAEVIEQADSLESLTGVVREMVEESHSVQSLVQQTQARLSAEHDRAAALSAQVEMLEGDLRRMSTEMQTDQLTQIANRRGLLAAFAAEQARANAAAAAANAAQTPSGLMALALLDIDNFKKLNDTLGHGIGDMALKSLAERVSKALRPSDLVARYGGEEFVLMLPGTPLDAAQALLQRLQRTLSASLFKHEGMDVFITFSAGVTLHRAGETLEAALDRADVALYQAKHSGKNRACVAD